MAPYSEEHTNRHIFWKKCTAHEYKTRSPGRNPMTQVPLSTIAHGRSGDKGNHANIAVIAYSAAGFAWLRQHLTAEVVQRYFSTLGPSRVVRYEAPNLEALNFVLYDVLAGGASRSLRSDTQGKALALALLEMPIEPGEQLGAMLRPKAREKA